MFRVDTVGNGSVVSLRAPVRPSTYTYYVHTCMAPRDIEDVSRRSEEGTRLTLQQRLFPVLVVCTYMYTRRVINLVTKNDVKRGERENELHTYNIYSGVRKFPDRSRNFSYTVKASRTSPYS